MAAARIGNFVIERIVEQQRSYGLAQTFFNNLTDDMLAQAQRVLPKAHFSDDGASLVLSFHSFVIKTGRHTILVDCCCGNDKERPQRPYFHQLQTDYLGAMTAANVEPEEIDFVMCTHLHWDHVGWNTRLIDGTWQPTFPNAKYIMARREYEYWDQHYKSGATTPHAQAFGDSVVPIKRAEQAVLVDDGYEVQPGISIEACPGHTPGNMVVNVNSQGAHGVMTGDVLHHPLQLMYPQLTTIADEDSLLAVQTRNGLVERFADTDTIVMPGHFIAPSVGRIHRQAQGNFEFKFV
jgi:glyoxylase-like metal-dependent hydrolase (beta-lactamase superfamily II)